MTESSARPDVSIRRATAGDAEAIADTYLDSFRATYAFPLVHTDAEVRAWIREVVVATEETWVAVDGSGRIVGFMALTDDQLDQLYLAPGSTGRGIGGRLLSLAMERRPAGFELYTFQENGRARRFYERHGLVVVDRDAGDRNEEGRPDVRYAWRPEDRGIASSGLATSADGTWIGWFREEPLGGDRPTGGADAARPEPVRPAAILVHGASADHTTWRTFGPMLAASRPVVSIDRRGRGASGDTEPYAIEREAEDIVALARHLVARTGGPVDVIGHSFGGRCALGAALIGPDTIRRVVAYEGAVAPRVGANELERLAALRDAGRDEELLIVFLRDTVEMTPAELGRYQAAPVWPVRVAAAPTIVREVAAGDAERGAWAGFTGVRQPVLQILGSDSPAYFREGAEALDQALADGRIGVVEGARHAAHHTHPAAFLELVRSFLDAS